MTTKKILYFLFSGMKYFKAFFVRLQMSKEQVSVLKQELKPNDINNFNHGRRSSILPTKSWLLLKSVE
ncbi:MAG: hypothetical protein ABJB85_00400 [Nitrososphaerota archaeon]